MVNVTVRDARSSLGDECPRSFQERAPPFVDAVLVGRVGETIEKPFEPHGVDPFQNAVIGEYVADEGRFGMLP